LHPDVVNARHAEVTPAGVSHHGGDSDMGDLPHRVPDDPRFFTADVHVTPDGRARIGGRDYTPEQYAELLRRSGYDGSRPVRLIGCDAGSNDFARRLSRELDAPVVAPNKPAWTDTRGRVYSSDTEIGPDGTRRPKIPPTGQWDTHHPDGTRTPAGDDGYAPGTRDTDRTDHTDTDGARDRGQDKSWQDEPGGTSGKTPKDKIGDLGYLNDHYYLRQRDDGSWELVVKQSPDADGLKVKPIDIATPEGWSPPPNRDVSQLDLDEVDIDFKDNRPPAEPASYHDTVVDQRGKVDQEVVERNQELVDERRELIDDAKSKEGTPEYPEAQDKVTKIGEELGERAAHNYADDVHPGSTRVDAELRGSGRFDVVRELDDGRHAIIEAKGPSASVSEAKALDGTRVEQGHDKYFDKKIDDMKNAELTGRAEAKMRERLANEGMTPDQINQAVIDHKAKLDSDRELAYELERARNPEVLADHLREQAGVTEGEIDEFLRKNHDVDSMSPEEFAKFKKEDGYNEFFRNKADELRSSPNDADRAVGEQLDHARRHGMVEYSVVTAKLTTVDGREAYDGYVAKQFRMGWQRDE
jgi:hypothetical protein